MKKVERYKCDFCNKIAARPETILKHEAECLKNQMERIAICVRWHIKVIMKFFMIITKHIVQ